MVATDPIQIRSRWYTGNTHPLPDGAAGACLRRLPRFNSGLVGMPGTDLPTIHIDLEEPGQ